MHTVVLLHHDVETFPHNYKAFCNVILLEYAVGNFTRLKWIIFVIQLSKMKMDTQYYYVHGLGSSRNSIKFKEIEVKYPNAICFEWAVGDKLDNKIKEWIEVVKNCKLDVVLIGSSTGANLICQMNEILSKSNNYQKTILLNPLLSLDQAISKELLPMEVLKYVREIGFFNGCCIILSDNDEVLNHKEISDSILKNNQIIISKKDNHNLLKFKEYFAVIDRYVASICI